MNEFASDIEELRRRLQTAANDSDSDTLLQGLETAYEELRTADEEVRSQQDQIASLIEGYDALRLQYERMLSLLPVPVLLTDERGLIKVANAAAAEFLRIRPGRMVGMPAQSFVAIDDRGEIRSALSSPSLRQGPLRRTVKMVPRGKEGVPVEVTLTSNPGGFGAVNWMLLSVGAVEKVPALMALPETVSRLSTLAATSSDVREALEASTQLVAGALGDETHVSIVTGSPLGPTATATSSELAQQVDGAQLMAGEGPCLTAYETATTVETEELATEGRWPRLNDRVPANVAAIAVPLTYGAQPVGVLAVYGEPSLLDAGLVEPCELFAATASAVIFELDSKAELASVAAGLERAMATRAVIEQAKGIVMGANGCDADVAFAYLVEVSSTKHVKLHDVARQIVEKTAQGEPLGA